MSRAPAMENLTELAPWPSRRSDRSAVQHVFGTRGADLVHRALVTGDPLADAVVAELHEHGAPARAQLARGIEHGLASLDDPLPATLALLTQTESVPEGVTDDLLEHGSLPNFGPVGAAHLISLSAGALIRTYQSPSIAEVLGITGRLVDGAARRIDETGTWQAQALVPGAMRVGAPGHVATVQVRMLHAQMRRLARSRGYDEAAHGVPINQVDLVRTWMDFTLVSYDAERRMGWEQTPDDLAGLYRYWQHIGHVLGIEPELIEGITSQRRAREVDDLLAAVTAAPIPGSVELADATLRSMAELLTSVTPLPGPLGLPVMHSLVRRFHGKRIAAELGVPRTPVTDRVLGLAIAVNRWQWRELQARPAKLRAARARHLAESERFIATRTGRTGYQVHDQH